MEQGLHNVDMVAGTWRYDCAKIFSRRSFLTLYIDKDLGNRTKYLSRPISIHYIHKPFASNVWCGIYIEHTQVKHDMSQFFFFREPEPPVLDFGTGSS